MVPSGHTVVVCVAKGGRGGAALINMGPLKVISSSFFREIDPHSGSVYTQWLYVLRRVEF